ncbi:MAG TPA: hypothetical protein VM100_10610 [Longimicrobiales bacterium]|nr:hypothetical protein [Longimicrobiales bacterium]
MRYLLPGSLLTVILGMVLVILGVNVPGAFYPGVYLIAIGLVGIAAAGIVDVVRS